MQSPPPIVQNCNHSSGKATRARRKCPPRGIAISNLTSNRGRQLWDGHKAPIANTAPCVRACNTFPPAALAKPSSTNHQFEFTSHPELLFSTRAQEGSEQQSNRASPQKLQLPSKAHSHCSSKYNLDAYTLCHCLRSNPQRRGTLINFDTLGASREKREVQITDAGATPSSLLDARSRGCHARVQLEELLVVCNWVPFLEQHVDNFPTHGCLHTHPQRVTLLPHPMFAYVRVPWRVCLFSYLYGCKQI